jgi:hypothetical protein
MLIYILETSDTFNLYLFRQSRIRFANFFKRLLVAIPFSLWIYSINLNPTSIPSPLATSQEKVEIWPEWCHLFHVADEKGSSLNNTHDPVKDTNVKPSMLSNNEEKLEVEFKPFACWNLGGTLSTEREWNSWEQFWDDSLLCTSQYHELSGLKRCMQPGDRHTYTKVWKTLKKYTKPCQMGSVLFCPLWWRDISQQRDWSQHW